MSKSRRRGEEHDHHEEDVAHARYNDLRKKRKETRAVDEAPVKDETEGNAR